MRRAQSVRNHHQTRPSLALGADDLGMLREGNESNEDVLRRQLLERDRENDRLQTQVQNLMTQLAQRPPIERIQQLEKEYKNLDLILQGTQRENERCMAELERTKQREKLLERELAKLAGENWQTSLDISPSTTGTTSSRPNFYHSRSNTMASSVHLPAVSRSETSEDSQQATLAHIEQVRLLILGMEQRLQTSEEKLVKGVERAEYESRKFDQLRKEVTTDS